MTARRGRPVYASYALGVLLIAYVLAFADRQILNLLVIPIQRDTGLSDIEVSLLQGLAFALFLSLGGLPIGRLVDGRRRTALLAVAVLLWSLFTGAFGMTRSFAAMLAARVGVGVGEAAMTPAAYSLIGDYFRARRLGIAAAIYGLGPYLGSGLALIGGGAALKVLPERMAVPALGMVAGWQLAFLALLPVGLVIALWVGSLPEPERRAAEPHAPSWRAVRDYFGEHWRALTGMNGAIGFVTMATYGLFGWVPAMLSRSYGVAPHDAGGPLGIVLIAACCPGALIGGVAGDWLRDRGFRTGRLMIIAAALAVAIPLSWIAPHSRTTSSFLLWLAPLLFVLAAAISSGPAVLQDITPNRIRGVQHAIAVLSATLIGLAIGPTAIAIVTETVYGDPARLAAALATTLPVMLTIALIQILAVMPSYARSASAFVEDQAAIASN